MSLEQNSWVGSLFNAIISNLRFLFARQIEPAPFETAFAHRNLGWIPVCIAEYSIMIWRKLKIVSLEAIGASAQPYRVINQMKIWIMKYGRRLRFDPECKYAKTDFGTVLRCGFIRHWKSSTRENLCIMLNVFSLPVFTYPVYDHTIGTCATYIIKRWDPTSYMRWRHH